MINEKHRKHRKYEKIIESIENPPPGYSFFYISFKIDGGSMGMNRESWKNDKIFFLKNLRAKQGTADLTFKNTKEQKKHKRKCRNRRERKKQEQEHLKNKFKASFGIKQVVKDIYSKREYITAIDTNNRIAKHIYKKSVEFEKLTKKQLEEYRKLYKNSI